MKQEPVYNGFPNPHNVVGHRCDINCFNSMTMANQFPHLASALQNQMKVANDTDAAKAEEQLLQMQMKM